jgi:hypothetical protein
LYMLRPTLLPSIVKITNQAVKIMFLLNGMLQR